LTSSSWNLRIALALLTLREKAEAELEQLRMHENHQAMKYFIKFQQLAA